MSIAAIIGSLSTLRRHAADLRQLWVSLRDSVRLAWDRLLHDDLVRTFYLALYNDAADSNGGDVTSGNSGSVVLAAASGGAISTSSSSSSSSVISASTAVKRGGGTPIPQAGILPEVGGSGGTQSASGDRQRSGGRTWIATQSMNADVPIIDYSAKVAEVDDEMRRYGESTDVDVALAGAHRELEAAYAALRRNLEAFRVDFCDSSPSELLNAVR